MTHLNDKFIVSEKYINKRCGLHLKEYQEKEPNPKNETDIQFGIINDKGKFTKCSNINHITECEYNDIIPKIIDEFISNGFSETVNFFSNTKDIDCNKIYKTLCYEDYDINKISSQKTQLTNKIIRKFMPHIFEVKDYNGINLCDLWTKEKLTNAFKLLNKPKYTVNSYLSEILKRLKFNPVTVYSPILTKSLLKELDCKTVFDPCIGWGGRMIGTCSINNTDNAEIVYTGCEPCNKTYEGLEEIVKDLNLKKYVDIYNSPVEDKLDDEKFKNKKFDMCLTSPPYYNLEIYSDEDTQSIEKYKDYEEWLDKFIEPIIKYVCEHEKK